MRCNQIEISTTNQQHQPPVATSPVDDRERARRAELRALDEHLIKVARARRDEAEAA